MCTFNFIWIEKTSLFIIKFRICINKKYDVFSKCTKFANKTYVYSLAVKLMVILYKRMWTDFINRSIHYTIIRENFV